MGINTVTTSLDSEIVRLNAQSAVNAGDLILNTENGKASVASTVLSVQQNNNNFEGVDAISPYASSGTWYRNGQSAGAENVVYLSNGVTVFAYSGNGTNNSQTNLNMVFKKVDNSTAYPPITITGETSINAIKVVPIGTTSFVVAWTQSSTLKFAIYNNDTTSVIGTTTVASTSDGDARGWDVGVTANGDIVFAYNVSTNAVFTRYNSSGVIQGTQTTISSSETPYWVKVLGHSSGDFWISFYRSVSTSAWKFARYDSTGTLQGSVTTITNGSTFNQIAPKNLSTELSNGNVCFLCRDSANPVFRIYSSTGSSVSSTTTISSNSVLLRTDGLPAICLIDGGFALVSKGTANFPTYFSYTNSGSLIDIKVISYNAVDTRPFQGGNLYFNGSYFTILWTAIDICGTQSRLYLLNFDKSLNTIGTAFTATSTTQNMQGLSSSITPEGIILFAVTQSSGPTYYTGVYEYVRKSIIGVAQESAAANNTFRVATKGTYAINQSFGFGGNFDNTTATVPGTKGSVVGSTAVLYGLN